MKKALLLTTSLLFAAISIAAPNIPDSVENIKVSLETKEEVDQALNVILNSNPKIYQSLKRLRKSNPKDFKKKLRNHYYTWLHTQVLIKNMPKKEKGYRQSVKESETELNILCESYKTASENEKPSIKNQLKKAAKKRYDIELKMKKFQVEQLKTIMENKQKEVDVFEKNSELFINRIVTKSTREQIKK